MELPQETPHLTFFTAFLKITGVWFYRREGSRWRRWFQNLRLVLFIVTVIFWDYLLCLQDPSELANKPYTPVVVWANTLLIACILYYFKAEIVEEWTERMSRMLTRRKRQNQALRFKRITSIVWRIVVWFGIIQTCLAALVSSAVSVPADLLLYPFTSSSQPFYIPMAMEGLISEPSRSLTFYTLELVNGLLLVIPMIHYSGILAVLVGYVLYISLEIEDCKERLEEWGARNGPQQRQLFHEIIDDHNEILKLKTLMETLISPCFLVHNSIAAFVVGNFLYLAKKAVSHNDVALMTTQLYFSWIATFNTFIPCYIGQLLYDQGQRFSGYLAELRWYEKTVDEVMEYQMILRQAQKPIIIDSKFKSPLNYVTFSEIMNKAYSLFILLDSIDK